MSTKYFPEKDIEPDERSRERSVDFSDLDGPALKRALEHTLKTYPDADKLLEHFGHAVQLQRQVLPHVRFELREFRTPHGQGFSFVLEEGQSVGDLLRAVERYRSELMTDAKPLPPLFHKSVYQIEGVEELATKRGSIEVIPWLKGSEDLLATDQYDETTGKIKCVDEDDGNLKVAALSNVVAVCALISVRSLALGNVQGSGSIYGEYLNKTIRGMGNDIDILEGDGIYFDEWPIDGKDPQVVCAAEIVNMELLD